MGKKKLHSRGFLLLTFIALFLLTGCTHFRERDDYVVSNAAAPESLHRIEPLELEKSEEEETLQFDLEAPAAAELELSLEECRALVLENNLDLKVQLIAPAIAAESVSEAEAKFEATFSASVNYAKTNQPMASYLEIAGNKLQTLGTMLGVSIPLRTGGEISVGLNDYATETDSEFSVYNPSYNNSLSASISQPLLRNAGRRASEYAIRIAEFDRLYTDAATKLQVIYAIAEADKAYWRLYAARQLLEVRKQQYEAANALHKETEAYVKVGSKPRIELIRTRANVANSLKAIIIAENDVRDLERKLKQWLNKPGLGVETETVLIPSSQPDPVLYDIQRDQMVADALENRMDLLEAELEIARNAASIEYQKNQRLPLVSLGYTYNINGLGPSRSDAYDLLVDNTYRDHRVGLQVSIPLGNEAAESRLRQAIYQRTQKLTSREGKKQQITYEVLRQIDTLEASWNGILVSRQATLEYDEQYRAEKSQFELGMVTSRDVLDAQTKLADARKDEIAAIATYQISLLDLAYATGTLLGAAKVQWEPVIPAE